MSNGNNVIDLCDDDEDDDVVITAAPADRVPKSEPGAAQLSLCRKFWTAGDYDSTSAPAVQGGMDHIRIHPKFLHTNATSHKWALGAIAELLDNAVDEVRNGATYVSIDKALDHHGNPMLIIQDDGGGMKPEGLRECMSFGFSGKSKTCIGQYGNGFKTSTMRLGADVLVFTRCQRDGKCTQSIGLLSYNYLRATKQEDVYVPMVDYSLPCGPTKPKRMVGSHRADWLLNLETIQEWSPFKSEPDLLRQFDGLGFHGTKIVVYNLWFNDDGNLELDFEADDKDVQLFGGAKVESNTDKNDKLELLHKHISHKLKFSLGAYASILYLRRPPGFRIILRGKEVEHYSMVAHLKHSEDILYKPQSNSNESTEVSVVTTIGFIKEAPLCNVHGFNVYHKNRLIMPFWRVRGNETSSRGSCVVGVLEANFMEPAHDKQDFEKSPLFTKLEARLKLMSLEYWKLNCSKIGYHGYSGKKRPMSEGRTAEPPSTPPRETVAFSEGASAKKQKTTNVTTDLNEDAELERLTKEHAELRKRLEDYESMRCKLEAYEIMRCKLEDYESMRCRLEDCQCKCAELEQDKMGLAKELDEARLRCASLERDRNVVSNELEGTQRELLSTKFKYVGLLKRVRDSANEGTATGWEK